MPRNIKNERVSNLAMKLAEETGASITDAVGTAVEARLQELHRERERVGLAEKLMEIGRHCAIHAPADWLTRDFDQELYGEKGLPQ